MTSPAAKTGEVSGVAPDYSKPPARPDTKALPPKAVLDKDYEAQRSALEGHLSELLRQGNHRGAGQIQEYLNRLEKQRQREIAVGALRDQFEAFRGAQPFGWR